jgi:hypothetical protein
MSAIKAKIEPENEPAAPDPLTGFSPEFAKISRKLAQLCQREDAILTELREIEAREGALAARFHRPAADWTRPKKPAEKVIEPTPGAVALLGDLAPPARTVVAFAPPVSPEARRVFELADELQAVSEAISVLRDVPTGEKYSEWEKARAAASAEYCKKIEPEYSRVVADYIGALVTLARAHEAHQIFLREKLVGVDYENHISPIIPMNLVGGFFEAELSDPLIFR